MTAPIITVEQAQAHAAALLERFTGTDFARDSGHRPFCWCHNHADADGVFHWTAELPALRFPLEGEST